MNRDRLILGSLGVGLACASSAWAQAPLDTANPVACAGPSAVQTIWEGGPGVSQNEIGSADQTIYSLGVARGACLRHLADTRLRLELNAAKVEESAGDSYAVLAGIGVQHSFGKIVVAPTVRFGYEDVYYGDNQVVASASVLLERTFPIGSQQSDTNLRLTLVPEYTTRRSAAVQGQGMGVRSDSPAVGAAAALDRKFSSDFGGQVEVTHNEFGGDAFVRQISSVSAGFGRLDKVIGGYNWFGRIRYSWGDRDYDGFQFALTFRGGKK